MTTYDGEFPGVLPATDCTYRAHGTYRYSGLFPGPDGGTPSVTYAFEGVGPQGMVSWTSTNAVTGAPLPTGVTQFWRAP